MENKDVKALTNKKNTLAFKIVLLVILAIVIACLIVIPNLVK